MSGKFQEEEIAIWTGPKHLLNGSIYDLFVFFLFFLVFHALYSSVFYYLQFLFIHPCCVFLFDAFILSLFVYVLSYVRWVTLVFILQYRFRYALRIHLLNVYFIFHGYEDIYRNIIVAYKNRRAYCSSMETEIQCFYFKIYFILLSLLLKSSFSCLSALFIKICHLFSSFVWSGFIL